MLVQTQMKLILIIMKEQFSFSFKHHNLIFFLLWLYNELAQWLLVPTVFCTGLSYIFTSKTSPDIKMSHRLMVNFYSVFVMKSQCQVLVLEVSNSMQCLAGLSIINFSLWPFLTDPIIPQFVMIIHHEWSFAAYHLKNFYVHMHYTIKRNICTLCSGRRFCKIAMELYIKIIKIASDLVELV